jgi:hypothetical protein
MSARRPELPELDQAERLDRPDRADVNPLSGALIHQPQGRLCPAPEGPGLLASTSLVLYGNNSYESSILPF